MPAQSRTSPALALTRNGHEKPSPDLGVADMSEPHFIDRVEDCFAFQLVRSGLGSIHFVSMSAGIENLLGITPSDACSNPSCLEGTLSTIERNRLSEAVEKALNLGVPLDVKCRHSRSGGPSRWLHYRGRTSQLLDGSVILSAVAMDVTDASEQLRQDEHALQFQKLEAIGRLAGGVAHDFNNILTVINGFSDMALASLPDDNLAKPFIAEVRKAGEKAAGLTRQLLTFSRKESLPENVFDLRSSVADLSKMLGRVIGEDVQLEVAGSDEPVWVLAHPSHFEQVLLNLAVNARDAMPEGGRLRIETGAVQVRAPKLVASGELAAGRYSVLTVRDTGTGMIDEVRRHLFEPFFTTKGVGKGTGLGLATVYGVVEQSGGHIEVESAVGQGTIFRIYFPVASPNAGAPSAHGLEQGSFSGQETILLVEDDDELRMLALRGLQDAGYMVLDAASGEAALRVTESFRVQFSLVVTEVVMPLLNGRQLVDRLRMNHPRLRALYMSGYTDHEVQEQGIETGEEHFIRKPVTMNALLCKIREILNAPVRG
jgi:two-component system, cell cycle sensor histidine kinase and response regulator CckA